LFSVVFFAVSRGVTIFHKAFKCGYSDVLVLKRRKEKRKGMKLNSLYYRKNLKASIILMVLVGAFILPALAEINSVGTYFAVSPARNIVKAVGESFTIDINIVNAPVNDTQAWEVTLEWTNTVLNITNVQQGTFFQGYNVTFISTPLSSAQLAGKIAIGAAIQGSPSNLPATAPGLTGQLCNVTFSVLSAGTSALDLKDTKLANRAGAGTDYPNNDGFFVATTISVHDVYIVNITTDVNVTQQGGLVNITIWLHDEGNYSQTVDVNVYADMITHNPTDPDTLAVQDELVVGTISGVVLDPCIPKAVWIIWNTAPVPGELWTINAEVVKVGDTDNDPHDNIYIGPQVLVVSTHDMKIVDKTILTPTVDRNVAMNFTGATGPVTSIQPCQWYQVIANPKYSVLTGSCPPPGTWWYILLSDPYESQAIGLEFHVDACYAGNSTFHIDQVLPAAVTGINLNWVIAEMTAKVAVTVKNEGKVLENADVYVFARDSGSLLNFSWVSGIDGPVLNACNTYVMNPVNPKLAECTWWHIIACPSNPELVSKEFHVDSVTGPEFHIDFVWPDFNEPMPGWALAEQEIVIGKQTVNVAPGASTELYFHWSLTGVASGTYPIYAFVYPVPGEEQKNWEDNKLDGGTITVKYYDVAVASVALADCSSHFGFYPIVVPVITLANLGTEITLVVVYYLADPDLTVTGDEIVFGIGVVSLFPGDVLTVTGCSPFGGWWTQIPAIAPPYNVPVPGTNYSIIAKAIPAPGYEDDNMANNANLMGPWQLPTVTHDLTATTIVVKGEIPYGYDNHVYKTCPGQAVHNLTVQVTIVNQGSVAQGCTVDLRNGTNPAILATANITNLAAGASQTITLNMSTLGLTANTWYTLLPNITVTCAAGDNDTCDNIQTAYGTFYVRLWGDVNNNGKAGPTDFGDVGKMYLIYSGGIPAPYLPDLMGDLNANCKVGPTDFGDVGKMYLIYSGTLGCP
jgi:hypothetical protein